MRSRVSTLSILSILSDSWKNLEIWKGGKKLPTLSGPSLSGVYMLGWRLLTYFATFVPGFKNDKIPKCHVSGGCF